MKKPDRLPAPFAPAHAPLTTQARVSEARLRANRLNAKKSTGPRTPQGKARSSRNALKSGVIARCGPLFDDLQPQDRALFQEVLDELVNTYRPRDPDQEILLRRAALCHVRLRRVERLETRWAAEHRRELQHAIARDIDGKLAALAPRLADARQSNDHAAAARLRAERAALERDRQRRLEDAALLAALPARDRLDPLIRYEGAIHRESYRVAREMECWLGKRKHDAPSAPI